MLWLPSLAPRAVSGARSPAHLSWADDSSPRLVLHGLHEVLVLQRLGVVVGARAPRLHATSVPPSRQESPRLSAGLTPACPTPRTGHRRGGTTPSRRTP
jgi:hypothetical protein